MSFISRFADADPTGDTRFYHRPLANDKNGIPSFSQQVVGRHKLQEVMNNICKKGGLTGHFTSHAPKASLGTQLYHLNVDELLIQERTGHRSVQALRRYKRTGEDQQVVISAALCGVDHAAKRAKVEEPRREKENMSVEPSSGEKGPDKLTSFITTAQAGAFSNCTFNIHVTWNFFLP